LSDNSADASAAIIESAHTGQVGKSLPRGAGCGDLVGRISAIAGIVTSSASDRHANNTPQYLTMSQHKCVGFTISLSQVCDAANMIASWS